MAEVGRVESTVRKIAPRSIQRAIVCSISTDIRRDTRIERKENPPRETRQDPGPKDPGTYAGLPVLARAEPGRDPSIKPCKTECSTTSIGTATSGKALPRLHGSHSDTPSLPMKKKWRWGVLHMGSRGSSPVDQGLVGTLGGLAGPYTLLVHCDDVN
eukprot:scaffold753_cov390-Pavlova_lutheri.AAC.2